MYKYSARNICKGIAASKGRHFVKINLRQAELDEMMARAKGAIGVSNQWLERKSALKEEIVKLEVKAHDLDLQISTK